MTESQMRDRMLFLFGSDKNHARRKMCPRCGKHFIDPTVTNQRTYCNRKCMQNAGASRRWSLKHPLPVRRCKVCGISFTPNAHASDKQRYCNRQLCGRKVQTALQRKYRGFVPQKLTCKCGCGTEFLTKSGRNVYASRRCRQRLENRTAYGKKKLARLRRTECKHCGKPFMTVKSYRVYCSKECNRLGGNAMRAVRHKETGT